MVITQTNVLHYCDHLIETSGLPMMRDTELSYYIQMGVDITIHIPENLHFAMNEACLLFAANHVIKYYNEPCLANLEYAALEGDEARITFTPFSYTLNKQISAGFSRHLKEFIKGTRS